jgi:hypothetical protein
MIQFFHDLIFDKTTFIFTSIITFAITLVVYALRKIDG